MPLSDVCLSSVWGSPLHSDSDTTFRVKKSKVKVTRPLCSPPRWRVRQLQRWVSEHVGRGKLLLRCRLLSGGRRFGAHWGRRGAGAYRNGRPPTACYLLHLVTSLHNDHFLVKNTTNYKHLTSAVGQVIHTPIAPEIRSCMALSHARSSQIVATDKPKLGLSVATI